MTGPPIRLGHPLVIGAGVSGLAVALGLPKATVISAGSGSTLLAQGGIAAAIEADDHPALHAADTNAVSGGLAVAEAVDILCSGGPGAIRRLLDLGARFDRWPDGRLRVGLEAGHSRRRIVASRGDSIGREVSRVLGEAAGSTERVHVLEGWTAVDLLLQAATVTGALVLDPRGRPHRIVSRGVAIATGGAGHLYRKTTNPADVHGSGIAMAGRAGARLTDLEFMQFHPTALDVGADPMPLVTEALRGAGATLIDQTGKRFHAGVHPAAELAPRDVVARNVWFHSQAGHRTYLDARHLREAEARFPTVAAAARAAGLNLSRDPLPVSAAAHYLMGGIDVDTRGRSSLRNLWAVGEAASTGVHGANRLASNSLLEGLVFSARTATDMEQTAVHHCLPGDCRMDDPGRAGRVPAEMEELRRLMWEDVGLVRTGPGLERALAAIAQLRPAMVTHPVGRAASDLARWMTTAALVRRESRGGHYRADHPGTDPNWQRRFRSTSLTPVGA